MPAPNTESDQPYEAPAAEPVGADGMPAVTSPGGSQVQDAVGAG